MPSGREPGPGSVVRTGVEIDWTALFGLYRPLAVRLACGVLEREELAEEVVQEAARSIVQRVAEARVAFESPEHARNYFLRAVRNLAVSAVRREQRSATIGLEEEPVASGTAPDGPVLAREESSALDRLWGRVDEALASLVEREREVLRMRYLEGASYREISERTGASISTLHSRVEAGLRKIRANIGNGQPEL